MLRIPQLTPRIFFQKVTLTLVGNASNMYSDFSMELIGQQERGKEKYVVAKKETKRERVTE
jgi:hypothetical protein